MLNQYTVVDKAKEYVPNTQFTSVHISHPTIFKEKAPILNKKYQILLIYP